MSAKTLSHVVLGCSVEESNLYLHGFLGHDSPTIRRTYKVINFKDTYVGNFIEGPFQGIGVLFPLFFIKFNLYSFLQSLLLINVRGMLRHDSRFIWLIGNHHILHHKYPQFNFGEYWLDNLFGTSYPNKNEYAFGLVYI